MIEEVNGTDFTMLIVLMPFRGGVFLSKRCFYLMYIVVLVKEIDRQLRKQQAAYQKNRRGNMEK